MFEEKNNEKHLLEVFLAIADFFLDECNEYFLKKDKSRYHNFYDISCVFSSDLLLKLLTKYPIIKENSILEEEPKQNGETFLVRKVIFFLFVSLKKLFNRRFYNLFSGFTKKEENGLDFAFNLIKFLCCKGFLSKTEQDCDLKNIKEYENLEQNTIRFEVKFDIYCSSSDFVKKLKKIEEEAVKKLDNFFLNEKQKENLKKKTGSSVNVFLLKDFFFFFRQLILYEKKKQIADFKQMSNYLSFSNFNDKIGDEDLFVEEKNNNCSSSCSLEKNNKTLKKNNLTFFQKKKELVKKLSGSSVWKENYDWKKKQTGIILVLIFLLLGSWFFFLIILLKSNINVIKKKR